MLDNKDIQEQIKAPEKVLPSGEQAVHFDQEKGMIPERREISQDDKRVSAELRREIEMMQLDPNAKKEAEAKAEKIEFLGEKEKIEHLLQTAREKGVIFSIQVAKSMNEPYLLDILHDTLAQEGFYKGFSSQDLQAGEKKNTGLNFFIFFIVFLIIVVCIFVVYKLWK